MHIQTPEKPEAYLLLHGNSGSHRDMEVLLPFLRPGVLILNPDLPQHGANILPGFLPRIETCTTWLKTGLELEKYNLTVIGFSDGANVGLELLKAPELTIRKALLLAPNLTLWGLKAWLIILIKFTEVILWSYGWIPALWRVRQRMKMMSCYSFKGIPLLEGREVFLVYAARDMIHRSEQKHLGELLRVQPSVLQGETHMSLPKSPGVATMLKDCGI